MNPSTIFGVFIAAAKRIWPAFVGIAGAIYFAAQGDYSHAANVLLVGLGLGQILHAASTPPGPPPAGRAPFLSPSLPRP